jgi:UDP-N-acetylglucosamine 2-epimerase (non-hydrolysing)
LRTYNLESPFPEEFNRQAVSKLTAIHFAPTEGARQCLRDEGFPDDSITVTGNTVIDALWATAGPISVRARTGPVSKMLLTVHRRENFGDPLRNIVQAIHALLEQEPRLEILWPVHPNRNVHALAYERLEDHPRVRLSTPLDYPDFVRAMVESDFILSDSGGVQEEAPALARPVLVLRETTERPEAVAAGVARLVGTGVESIVSNVTALMHDQRFYADMAKGISPYGDGQASRRIVDRLYELFNAGPAGAI